MAAKLFITFTAHFDDQPRTYEVEGHAAETLACLIQAANAGLTSLEMNCSTYQIVSSVHDLRRKFGLDIFGIKELHEGQIHTRYILITGVTIIGIEQR